MVFRRRTQRKRVSRKKRMTIFRRLNPSTGMMQRRKISTPMLHSFKRMYAGGSQIPGNALYAPLTGVWSGGLIALNAVVNSSDFANLYDQYRINYVVLKFWLKVDPSAQTAANASYPRLYWYRDLDDANAPTNLNEIRENGKSRVTVLLPNRPVTIKFKPNTLQLIYQSAIANQFKPVWGQWLDMTTTSTPHYGIKYAVDDLTNTNYRLDIEATYYFQCRQPR